MLEYESEQYEGYNQEYGKKKSGKNIWDKEYSLNRIFRKVEKIELPSVRLNANLFDIFFPQISSDFGPFDIVHCSLPLEVLA